MNANVMNQTSNTEQFAKRNKSRINSGTSVKVQDQKDCYILAQPAQRYKRDQSDLSDPSRNNTRDQMGLTNLSGGWNNETPNRDDHMTSLMQSSFVTTEQRQ